METEPGRKCLLSLSHIKIYKRPGRRHKERRSFVKVLVDISIHTTSHASDTAQNKLCSFWMGPVLLWSVINQKKDDLTIIDGSSLFKFVTER